MEGEGRMRSNGKNHEKNDAISHIVQHNLLAQSKEQSKLSIDPPKNIQHYCEKGTEHGCTSRRMGSLL